MKLKLQHAPFIASLIALDLSKSKTVEVIATVDKMKSLILEKVQADIKTEQSIEQHTRELMEEIDDIEYEQVNEKILFSKIKKQIAKERGFTLDTEDRYGQLSHDILDELIEERCIACKVNEKQIKTIILKSFQGYMVMQDVAYTNTLNKIKNYKRKLIPGSDEYEMIFARMYEEELGRIRN